MRYPFADPRSTTKVKRPGKRTSVWVNTPKGEAAVTEGFFEYFSSLLCLSCCVLLV